jgi:tetratricopeptide (TPR) repeat protein
MKRTKFIFIFLIMCNLGTMGQIVRTSGSYNQLDTTSTYSGKYTWNLSRIVSMMKWIEGSRRGCTDTVYLSQLDVIYRELKVYCETRVNYALLDKQLNRLNSTIDKAWKDNYQRSTPYGLLRKAILAKKPDETDQLMLDGIRFREENEQHKSYQSFKAAVEKDPARLDNYYFVIMDELAFTKDTAKALNYLSDVIGLTNGKSISSFNPYLTRAWVYASRKQYQQSMDDLNLLIAKDTNDQVLLYNHASLKEKMQDFAGCMSDYQHLLRSLRIKPSLTIVDSAEVLNSIGWTYYLSKQYKLCVEYADKSLLVRPDDSHTLDTRGSGYFGLGEYEKCIDDMTLAIGLDPDLANSWYLRGLSYQKLDFPERACADLSKAAGLGLVEAAEAMKELCPSSLNTGVENQRQFPIGKPTNSKNRVGINYNGILYFRFK